MNKHVWLDAAEVFDSWRVVPRLVLGCYGAYVAQTTNAILHWYFNQPATARGTEESAVVIAVVSAVTGFAPWVFRIYSDSGRDWNARQPLLPPLSDVNDKELSK